MSATANNKEKRLSEMPRRRPEPENGWHGSPATRYRITPFFTRFHFSLKKSPKYTAVGDKATATPATKELVSVKP